MATQTIRRRMVGEWREDRLGEWWQADRQTDRQFDREADIPTTRQASALADRHADRQGDADRPTERPTDRQTDGATGRQADTQYACTQGISNIGRQAAIIYTERQTNQRQYRWTGDPGGQVPFCSATGRRPLASEVCATPAATNAPGPGRHIT